MLEYGAAVRSALAMAPVPPGATAIAGPGCWLRGGSSATIAIVAIACGSAPSRTRDCWPSALALSSSDYRPSSAPTRLRDFGEICRGDASLFTRHKKVGSEGW